MKENRNTPAIPTPNHIFSPIEIENSGPTKILFVWTDRESVCYIKFYPIYQTKPHYSGWEDADGLNP